MDPKYVYAKESCVLSLGPHRHRVTRGEAWLNDDPVVVAHPGVFADKPIVRNASVEQATAKPGEKRTTRRA